MARRAERSERIGQEPVRIGQEGLDEPAVRAAVHLEPLGGRLERTIEERSGPIVQRVRDRRARPDPAQAVLRERQRAKKGGKDAHRMHGRADVVGEPRQRELGRPGAAADLVARFEHHDGRSSLGERNRRGETVRTRADDDRVAS